MNSKIADSKGNTLVRDYKIELKKVTNQENGVGTWSIKAYFFVKLPDGTEIPDREYYERYLREVTDEEAQKVRTNFSRVFLYALKNNVHVDDTPICCPLPEPSYTGTWDSGD